MNYVLCHNNLGYVNMCHLFCTKQGAIWTSQLSLLTNVSLARGMALWMAVLVGQSITSVHTENSQLFIGYLCCTDDVS